MGCQGNTREDDGGGGDWNSVYGAHRVKRKEKKCNLDQIFETVAIMLDGSEDNTININFQRGLFFKLYIVKSVYPIK